MPLSQVLALLDTTGEHIADTLDLVNTRNWQTHGILRVTLGGIVGVESAEEEGE